MINIKKKLGTAEVKKRRAFVAIYVMSFFFALSIALPTYINSSFLSRFILEKNVGIFYAIASLLSLLALIWIPSLLKKIGNYKIILLLLIINTLSLFIIAFCPYFLIAISALVIHLILTTIILFNFDVLLENLSTDNDTGGIRGTYLSIKNSAWVVAPILTGFVLTNGDYWKIYTLSGVLLLPIIYLLIKNFKNFEDPNYKKILFWGTLKIIKKRKNVFRIFMSSLLLDFFFSWMVIYTPIYLHNHLEFSWTVIGIMFTIMLLPFPLLEMPLGKLADEKYGEKEMLNTGFIIIAITTAILTFITSTNAILWTVMLFATRIGASMVEITTESYFFKKIKSDDSNLLSFFRMTRPVAYIIGPISASILLAFVAPNYLFVILGFIVITAGLYFSLDLEDTK
ncbi:hypothetical protein A2442_03250 [Candidatus Campbellbacteria bacterium RIFOXYC2_FULL_35_25]|uniref:Major facilitator superfamily (MFS) profile domain-containing protein n=1 Tax=Candidatus Campbellbacteria bacterium RIFOXYC2_FULL_35_25 TaxID=1797582 RepID=A0A1F5EJU4_9BACT|nr:MAG: hypothetical protein A2442_03250 [Candidatus Campbellbacteria bacterium RIFOXYC2_FULL_35_25]